MGYIEGELDNEWILDYLKKKRNINVELVNGSSYKAVKTLLIHNKVDFIVDNPDSDIKNKGKNIKEVFEFSSGEKYIVANKNNKELIKKLMERLVQLILMHILVIILILKKLITLLLILLIRM